MLQVLGKIHKMSYNNFPSYKPLLKCDAYKLGLISSSDGQVACTFLPAATLGAVRSMGAKKPLVSVRPSLSFIICLIDFLSYMYGILRIFGYFGYVRYVMMFLEK